MTLLLLALSVALDLDQARVAVRDLIERERAVGTVTVQSIELPERVLLPAADYEVKAWLPPGGLRAGRQRIPLTVRFVDGAEKRLAASAVLQIEGPTLVTVHDVARGQRLKASDVRLEVRAYPPGEALVRALPSGAVARNPLRAGQPLAARNLLLAAPVEAGQKIRALFQNGDVQLQIDSVARNRGEIGALITVAGLDGRPLQARVTGDAQVEIVSVKEQR